MSEAPVPEIEEIDEDDHGPAVPEPPRRVPFGIALTTTLLGVVTLTSLLEVAITTDDLVRSDSVAESVGWGLLMALGAVGAAVTAAVAWSFTRNGKTIGAQVIGGLVVLAGLIALIDGVATEDEPAGVGTGVLYLVLGLSLIVVPLLGDGPVYLAARRVWSDAERDWLRSLATPDAPPALPFQHQPWPAPPPQHQPWPAQPPQHQPWPAQQPPWAAAPQPAQPQAGYTQQPAPPQYQYPPQQPAQPWAAPNTQHYQAWPEPTATGPAWSAQQPPAHPAAAYPASAQPASGHPAPSQPASAQPVSGYPAPAQPESAYPAPAETTHAQPTPPRPAAQQAPTEPIQAPQHYPASTAEPQEPTEPRPQT